MKRTMAANRKTAETITVAIDKLILHPGLPRNEFTKDELESMAETAKRCGILNPPLAREFDCDGDETHELLAGSRRLATAVHLGWKSIDCRLVTCRDDKAAWALVGIEQFERSDWSLIERAVYLQGLCDPDRGGYTYAQAADLLGREHKSWTAHHVALLELPDVAQELLHAGELLDLARGRILCRYRDRPEIVLAICEAVQHNRDAWTPRSKFEDSAARIAARFESPKQPGCSEAAGHVTAGPRQVDGLRPATVATQSREQAPDLADELAEPEKATQPITQTAIVSFLAPYEYDLRSLRLILQVTRSWIRAVEEALQSTA